MDLLTRDDLKKLTDHNGLSASFFMSTVKAGPETEQNRIKLKNLIKTAESELENAGLKEGKIKTMLKPLSLLLQDREFLNHQNNGLVFFVSEDDAGYFRLPLKFEDLVIVGTKFHLKPLLPLFNGDGLYYVLSVAQNKIKLLKCTHYSVEEVEIKGIPKSIAEALWYDDPESQIQSHTTGSSGTVSNKPSSIFHGHGTGIDDNKNNIRRFFQQIDSGLHDYLSDKRAPLIFSGVDYLMPIYKEVNTYPHLMEQGVIGNPENLSNEVLKNKAWSIVKSHFEKSRIEAEEKYNSLEESHLTSDSIEAIAPAAYNGRIETLFVAVDIQQWGTFNEKTNKVDLHHKESPEAEDLLDFAAIHTFITGGNVYAVDIDMIPGNKPYGAILRY